MSDFLLLQSYLQCDFVIVTKIIVKDQSFLKSILHFCGRDDNPKKQRRHCNAEIGSAPQFFSQR